MRFLDFGYSATVMLATFLLLLVLLGGGWLLLRRAGVERAPGRMA
jgi:multiple sugar transport system permease protein